jgi:hypothetical protein
MRSWPLLAFFLVFGATAASGDTVSTADSSMQAGQLVFSVSVQDFPPAKTEIYYRRVGDEKGYTFDVSPGFLQHRDAFLHTFDSRTLSALSQAEMDSKFGSNDEAVYRFTLQPATYEIYQIKITGVVYPMKYQETLDGLHILFRVDPGSTSYIGRMAVVAIGGNAAYGMHFVVVFTDQADLDLPVAQQRFGDLGRIESAPIVKLLDLPPDRRPH